MSASPTPRTTPHPTLPETGVLVIGGGVVGMATAGFLAQDGAEVALIDAGYVGGTTVNAGSLHVQMQTVFLQRFPHLVPALESSLHLYKHGAAYWKAFQEELGVDCEVKIGGGLMVAEDQRQLDFLIGKAKREKERGLDVTILDRGELECLREPALDDGDVGSHLPHCASLRRLEAELAVQLGESGR